jgi:hypothetical protein
MSFGFSQRANDDQMPYHFAVTVLMAMHVFLQEQVDVVIMEVSVIVEAHETQSQPPTRV